MGVAMQSDVFPVDFTETWHVTSGTQVKTGTLQDGLQEGRLCYIETPDQILVFGEIGTLDAVEHSTFQSYTVIFDALRDKGYASLVRFWNFIPDINGMDAQSVETYQAFCLGRALAFDQSGMTEPQMPAATGIGSHSKAIVGYLVASKHAEHLHVENPMQSPAYTYPLRYGPKPPSFARGTVLDQSASDGRGGTRFYLSGTASIRQTETIWQGDIDKQLQTTLENISMLVGAKNPQLQGRTPPMTLSDFSHFKVYFRRPGDYARIRDVLVNDWQIDPQKLYFMNVDICRSDLLVELEGCIN